MRLVNPIRFAGLVAAAGAALLALSACQARPTPSVAAIPDTTSPFVRNVTDADVNVYVVPKANETPVWLTSVAAGRSQRLPVRWDALQANGSLVVRTQILGRTKTWTRAPLLIDDEIVGALDLRTSNSITTLGSALCGVTTQAFNAAMR